MLKRPSEIGKGALLALGRSVLEEYRKIPVTFGMIVAPRARAEQHDPLDALAKPRKHPRAKAHHHWILRAIARRGDVQGRPNGHQW